MILFVNTLTLLGAIALQLNNPTTVGIICVVVCSISVGVILSLHIIAKMLAQKQREEGRQ